MGMFRQPTQASQAIAILTISLQLIFPVSTQLLKRQISNCLRSFQHKTYRHITAGSPTGYQQTADCWSTVGRWSADTLVCNITKTVGRQLAFLTVRMIYSPVRTVCPSVRNFYSSYRTANQTVQIIYSPVRTVRQTVRTLQGPFVNHSSSVRFCHSNDFPLVSALPFTVIFFYE